MGDDGSWHFGRMMNVWMKLVWTRPDDLGTLVRRTQWGCDEHDVPNLDEKGGGVRFILEGRRQVQDSHSWA